MAKYFTTVNEFKYSWDQVAAGFWQRYPNPYSKHVLSEDVVDRKVADNKLYTKRLLTKTNHMPKWGEKIVPGPKYVALVEESVVDPKAKTLTTYTRNVGYTRLMSVVEKCIFKVDEKNSKWSQVERYAWIDSNVIGVGGAIKHFGMERFKHNVNKACKGFEYVLDNLYPGLNQVAQDTGTMAARKEKLAETAKKAKEIAKAKASRPITANCSGQAASS
ncbi:unnamed protein product [Owenia fusiformis]|uniref:PRELI/MSF1 domain-containing protein n=1 Tax=Owenia fusiformis TaxID=6347 RepID=A0A8S4NTI7_OWEFU|nr:unnamed protein product [Owenia fusiformis]